MDTSLRVSDGKSKVFFRFCKMYFYKINGTEKRDKKLIIDAMIGTEIQNKPINIDVQIVLMRFLSSTKISTFERAFKMRL